jgi:hypothetical protein
MVRWNAGTGHVRTQRQTLSPAAPKIEILADGNQFLTFASRDRPG